ncbi:MAG: hypothetical protein ABIA63_04355 [bacterium]
MTKKERQRILKAIDYFLDEDPDKWVDGIDELFLMAYGIRWTEHVGLNKLYPEHEGNKKPALARDRLSVLI